MRDSCVAFFGRINSCGGFADPSGRTKRDVVADGVFAVVSALLPAAAPPFDLVLAMVWVSCDGIRLHGH